MRPLDSHPCAFRRPLTDTHSAARLLSLHSNALEIHAFRLELPTLRRAEGIAEPLGFAGLFHRRSLSDGLLVSSICDLHDSLQTAEITVVFALSIQRTEPSAPSRSQLALADDKVSVRLRLLEKVPKRCHSMMRPCLCMAVYLTHSTVLRFSTTTKAAPAPNFAALRSPSSSAAKLRLGVISRSKTEMKCSVRIQVHGNHPSLAKAARGSWASPASIGRLWNRKIDDSRVRGRLELEHRSVG